MDNALVVDDEFDICVLLTAQLRKLGFKATYCLTVKEANFNLRNNVYDIVFVDLNLPDGSGYDVIHAIRAKDKEIKIVVISAYSGEFQKVMDVGANTFVPKPFTTRSITDALEQLNFLNN